MLPIHIIGHAGCGKTTLIVELIRELIKKEVKVGSLKHTAHHHELDKPGKDSFLHREAGAVPVSMMTKRMAAVYLPVTGGLTPEKLLDKYYSDVDVVLVEGWISGPYEKIEIWNREVKREPLFSFIENVKVFVTDDADVPEYIEEMKRKEIRHIHRHDLSSLSELILAKIQ